MSSQGPNSPGTASSATWADTNNVFVSDDVYSTVTNSFGSTGTIDITNYSFSIPAGATIDGVVVDVERKVSTIGGNPRDLTIQIIKGGTASGDNKASGSTWPTSDGTATYGTASDLWGLALTDTDVNASIRIEAQRNIVKGAVTYSIDWVGITIFYTEASGPTVICHLVAGGSLLW